jgi:hypothetical protein
MRLLSSGFYIPESIRVVYVIMDCTGSRRASSKNIVKSTACGSNEKKIC